MKESSGHILKGKVVEISKDKIMTRITVDIGGDIVVAIITDEALRELDAHVGDDMEILVDSGGPGSGFLH